MEKTIKIVVKTFFGLEEVLQEELKELGYESTEKLNRAVQLTGTWKDVYHINLFARCALSVLVELRSFQISEENDLYKEALKVDWPSLFGVDKTFAIKGAVNSHLFKHSQFPFLLVKDAVADVFRKETGERPDVNIRTPQVVIDLYVRENQGTLSVNTSGLPLFHRGYRQSTGEAPLNEVVAAGLIRLSGWDRKSTFVDPFCGSGTLLIEAALLATGIPSTIERTHYAFKNLTNYNSDLWEEMHAAANKIVKELPCIITGSDIDADMVTIARRNLRNFSFGRFIQIQVEDVANVKFPEEKGTLITNPPYGERLETDVVELYEQIGSTFKHQLQGYTCWVISSSDEGFKSVGLRPERKIKLFNGDLECSFRKFTIYDGSKKAKNQHANSGESETSEEEEE
jgi:putative N6-adenine-specific DNA methylase